MRILTIENKKHEKFLRTRVPILDLKKENKKELRELIREMRKTMKEAYGIGLSANQVGLSKRFFIAEVPIKENQSKFYAIINPVIKNSFKETETREEGCLSIPNVFGPVERPAKISLEGLNVQAKKIKIKAWGLLARVFQHEIDHLDGVLFIDKAREIYEIKDGQKPARNLPNHS